MQPEKDGTYRAEVMSAAAGTGAGGAAQVVFQFALTEEFTNGEWYATAEGQEIRGYQYLLTKAGAVNETTVNNLREALGWPNDDPFWFEDQLDGEGLLPVQIVLGWEEYQGKPSLKVKWINAYDRDPSAGSLAHVSDDERRALRQQVGAKLRAFGATPSAAKPAPPPRNAVPANDGLTEEVVWGRWCSECVPAGIKDKERADLYNAAIRSLNREDVGKNISPDEWRQVEIALEETLEKHNAELEADRAALAGEA